MEVAVVLSLTFAIFVPYPELLMKYPAPGGAGAIESNLNIVPLMLTFLGLSSEGRSDPANCSVRFPPWAM